MDKTIIGSTALKYWLPNFREPKDLDYLYNGNKFYNEEKIEYIPAPSFWNHKEYASCNEVLTIKCSHIFWTPVHRNKHFHDIEMLLNMGFIIDETMFYGFYNHWKYLYGKRSQSNQNLDINKFFDDELERNIHHDDVHLIINPNPIYKKILIGDGTVNICKNKFQTLTYKEQLDIIFEEVYVLSFERWDNKYNNYVVNYRNNLYYFLCHLAPTWLSLFGFKNLLEINKPKINYKKLIDNGQTRNT